MVDIAELTKQKSVTRKAKDMGFQIHHWNRQKFADSLQGEFGLEKETLRVDRQGYLAHTPHPFPGDPKRDRDFCENQVEMITGVHTSVEGVLEELGQLHLDTAEKIVSLQSGKEYLWPFSNPPYVKGEDDIEIAHFDGDLKEKERYREYLAEKYGKMKMLFSGIHFNFSFVDTVLEEDYRIQRGTTSDTGKAGKNWKSFQEYKNDFYLDLARKTLKYSWLIVYLTAASPLVDASFWEKNPIHLGETRTSEYASIRCGREGYWNPFVPVLDFTSLDGYTESIQSYVEKGLLKMPSELYYPVRLKPKGLNNLELLSLGVNHIELRMFDLNPLSQKGIDQRDLEFVYVLLTYLALLPEDLLEEEAQKQAISNMKRAALLDADRAIIMQETGETVKASVEGMKILANMESALEGIFPEKALKNCLAYQREKLEQDEKRYANRILKKYGKDYVGNTLQELKSCIG